MIKILDSKYGPLSGRAWLLIANFAGNAAAIHGAILHVIRGLNSTEMYAGLAISIVCCLLLAFPSR
jgi:hypothetical protein